MRCEYCDVEVTTYPDNGICVCCGGKLPPRPISNPARPVQTPAHIPYRQPIHYVPGINCCPRCRNSQITMKKQGFSWGWGIAGFFLIPGFGALLGLIGRNKLRYRCQACGHKWMRN